VRVRAFLSPMEVSITQVRLRPARPIRIMRSRSRLRRTTFRSGWRLPLNSGNRRQPRRPCRVLWQQVDGENNNWVDGENNEAPQPRRRATTRLIPHLAVRGAPNTFVFHVPNGGLA